MQHTPVVSILCVPVFLSQMLIKCYKTLCVLSYSYNIIIITVSMLKVIILHTQLIHACTPIHAHNTTVNTPAVTVTVWLLLLLVQPAQLQALHW